MNILILILIIFTNSNRLPAFCVCGLVCCLSLLYLRVMMCVSGAGPRSYNIAI